MSDAPLAYEIDANDTLVWVNDQWESNAVANGSTALAPAQVLGKSLWLAIADVETRHLYTLLLKRVRSGHTLCVPLRCDSHTRRRFMLLTLRPKLAGGVRFETAVVRAEERAAQPIFDVTQPRSAALVTLCSWCLRAKVTPENWTEVEDAVTRLDLFSALPLPQLTHGVCPRCHAQLLATLEQ